MVAFSPDALAAFLDNEDTSAIVMLNLIRFQPDGGRQCYHQYLRLAEPILAGSARRLSSAVTACRC